MNDRIARYIEMIDESPSAEYPVGRSAATLDVIFQRVADGESLTAICKAWDVPHGKILLWLMADAKKYEVYQRALEVAAHALVAETIAIADTEPGCTEKGSTDTGAVAHAKLKIETRFRLAKYHAAELYGDKAAEQAPVKLIDAGLLVDMGDLLSKLGAKRASEMPATIDVTPEREQGAA